MDAAYDAAGLTRCFCSINLPPTMYILKPISCHTSHINDSQFICVFLDQTNITWSTNTRLISQNKTHQLCVQVFFPPHPNSSAIPETMWCKADSLINHSVPMTFTQITAHMPSHICVCEAPNCNYEQSYSVRAHFTHPWQQIIQCQRWWLKQSVGDVTTPKWHPGTMTTHSSSSV